MPAAGKTGLHRRAPAWFHIQYRHADGRGTTVPLHKGRDIAPSLLRKISQDIGLTAEELLENR